MNQTQLLTLFNEASQDELIVLSGIGPALADRLVAARPFDSLGGAKKVSGITAVLLDRLIEAGSEEAPQPAAEDQVVEEVQVVDETQMAPEPQAIEEVQVVDETQMTPEPQAIEDVQVVDEIQMTPDPQIVEEKQEVDKDQNASEFLVEDETPTGSRLSDIKETFKEKSQAISEGLTELGEHVSKRGQATRQAVGALSEKLEQSAKNRGQLWTVLISSTITALAAILLTLAVLGGINGSLKFATGSQYATMQREAAQMASQVALLQQDLDGLRGRVDMLEGFGERTVALEKAQEQLAADVEAASQQVTDMQDQVIAMNEKITQQEERTLRFDTFLKELQTLLGNLFAPQGEIQ